MSLWINQHLNFDLRGNITVYMAFVETIVLAALILLVLGLITVCSQTVRALRRNPVEALKAE